jgi:hypothetical protein
MLLPLFYGAYDVSDHIPLGGIWPSRIGELALIINPVDRKMAKCRMMV